MFLKTRLSEDKVYRFQVAKEWDSKLMIFLRTSLF